MKNLKKIIDIIHNNRSVDEKMNELGVVVKTIGKVFVLEPIIDDIKGMVVVKVDDKIVSLSVVLSVSISLIELKNELSENYSCNYNHYDEQTVVSFKMEQDTINVSISGYIEENDIKDLSFKRFDITMN
jgi:hypothetical protein